MMIRFRSPFVCALIACLISAAPGAALPQDPARTLVLESFHSDIEVLESGVVEVVEELQVRFVGSWNGVSRRIPVAYDTPSGFSYALRLEILSVTDDAGRDLRYEVSGGGGYRQVKMWVPDARDAGRTVRLRYRVPNGLRFFEEHDELFWNVTGTEWDYPILEASALVTLPDRTTDRRANAFTGRWGSEAADAGMTATPEGYYFETAEPLGLREGLTIAVAWAPGVVHRPGPLEKVYLFLRSNWYFLAPIVSFLAMFLAWRRWGKDPERMPVSPQYEPPDGMRPGEVGTIVDDRVDMRDLTATIVDLAIRGYLRIEEVEDSAFFGLIEKNDYRMVLLRGSEEWAGELHPYESRLLGALFDGPGSRSGASSQLSDLENRFYKELSDIRSELFDRLMTLGIYRTRPDHVKTAWVVGGLIVLAGSFFAGVAVAATAYVNPGPAILAAFLTGLPILGFGLFMPRRTVAGTRTLERVLGLREFMDRVESDRYRRMITSPKMFEELLPYAMALGVEKRWARAFEDIFREQPDWYVGHHPGGFHPSSFTNRLSTMSAAASAAMASQPRSSGSSGFGGGGGGGFSGGGFGGGGGGGF